MAGIPSIDDVLAPEGRLANSPFPAQAHVEKPEIPSLDDILGPSSPPSWVSSSDRAIQNFTQHVLNGFGYGAQQAFGTEPVATPYTALSPETADSLKKLGVFNDYTKGQNALVRSMAEGTIRTLSSGAQLFGRASSAVAGGFLGAAAGAGEQLGITGLTGEEGLVGAATDPGMLMLLGPLGMSGVPEAEVANARRISNLKTTVSSARANGVIGETAGQFYGAEPLTPADVTARADAARETGEAPAPPLSPPKDVHELARRIDPEAFYQYDDFAVQKQMHRETIQRLADERRTLPEAQEAENTINTILGKVAGVQDRLTNVARQRLEDAQVRLHEILTTDSPEMTEAREALQAADVKQRDLVPDVAAAYRQARDMMPEKAGEEITPAANENKAVEPKQATEEITPEPGPLLAQYEKDREAVGVPKVEPIVRPQEAGEAGPSTGAERTTTGLRSIKGTGEVEQRALSEGVAAKAIEKGLSDNFGDILTYNVGEHAPQFEQVAQIIATDYERAKDIAMGRRQPPPGVHPEAFFVGVENEAIARGDAETIRDLGTRSKLSAAATTMGQRIRLLGERDPTAPTGAIQDVQAARMKAAPDLQAQTEAVVNEIKAARRAAASPKAAWDNFIAQITCKE
jgi:hypothetical protein